MLDVERLQSDLPSHGLGEPLHFFQSIGSTNDHAMSLARDGAPHGTLVVAEEQTEGKGRFGRKWFTPPNSALAFSLLLRPEGIPIEAMGDLTALGALAVAEAIEGLGIEGQIKWPNDVMLIGQKVAGVLVEGSWIGDQLEHAILGIGINVRPESVPPKEEIDIPATCIDTAVGGRVDRHDLMLKVIEGAGKWLPQLGSPALINAWNQRLAYRDQAVIVKLSKHEIVGKLLGVGVGGRLQLMLNTGEIFEVAFGDVHLRPVDMKSKSAKLV
ncbi:MAG TPA: biotin--[acetyl-CoA-carboxylase] ligase [Anaerolineae bacterium]|nr:biotin--[acetyl-CoA-carboxylase] ligase [Anaerolineae bacterium]